MNIYITANFVLNNSMVGADPYGAGGANAPAILRLMVCTQDKMHHE